MARPPHATHSHADSTDSDKRPSTNVQRRRPTGDAPNRDGLVGTADISRPHDSKIHQQNRLVLCEHGSHYRPESPTVAASARSFSSVAPTCCHENLRCARAWARRTMDMRRCS